MASAPSPSRSTHPRLRSSTLDLPEKYTEAEVETLSRGDKEWVRLSRTSTGFAFQGHPAAARIHQLRGNSLTFEPPPELHNVDLCFIDGGHSYECIKADTQTALKILAPNGVIVWDDYSWFAEGVGQYLTELRQSLPAAPYRRQPARSLSPQSRSNTADKLTSHQPWNPSPTS